VATDSGLSSRINLVILDGAHDFRSTFNTGPGRNWRASPSGARRRLRALCRRAKNRARDLNKSRDTNRADYSLSPFSALILLISASSSALSGASVSWMATFFKSPVNLNGT
jgi:hypothetical protein